MGRTEVRRGLCEVLGKERAVIACVCHGSSFSPQGFSRAFAKGTAGEVQMISCLFTLPEPCHLLFHAFTSPAFSLPGSFDFLTCLVFLGSIIAWCVHRQSRQALTKPKSVALLLQQLLGHPDATFTENVKCASQRS